MNERENNPEFSSRNNFSNENFLILLINQHLRFYLSILEMSFNHIIKKGHKLDKEREFLKLYPHMIEVAELLLKKN